MEKCRPSEIGFVTRSKPIAREWIIQACRQRPRIGLGSEVKTLAAQMQRMSPTEGEAATWRKFRVFIGGSLPRAKSARPARAGLVRDGCVHYARF
jgi:hypothetical protein